MKKKKEYKKREKKLKKEKKELAEKGIKYNNKGSNFATTMKDIDIQHYNQKIKWLNEVKPEKYFRIFQK